MAAKKKNAREASKSQAIRDHLKRNPDATPRQVVSALKEQGVEVSSSLVGNIKYSLGRGGSKKRGRRKQNKRTSAKSKRRAFRGRRRGDLTAEDLLEVKILSDRLGGIPQVRKALDMLEELQ